MSGPLWEPEQQRGPWPSSGRLVSAPDEYGIERLRPPEGWASILLVLVLCFVTAWSIADARWILGRDDLTSFLPWVAVVAGFWGYLSSRLAIPRWAAHLIGAVVGAFFLSVVVGYVIDPKNVDNPFQAFDTTARSVAQAYIDLAIEKRLTTTQVGHFCLVLGIIVWGTAQAATYDVFGHRRAVNGVLLLAVALVANMALTVHDQYFGLVVFTAASLLLLLRAHAADERTTWIRHRIWQARATETPHLRAGMIFASTAVVGSLLLTSVASSAPLADAWQNLPDNVREFATWIERYLPAGGQSRVAGISGDFTGVAKIGGSWTSTNDPVFEVRVPDTRAYHWRMVVFDRFDTTAWGFSNNQQKQSFGPNQDVLGDTADATDAKAADRERLTFEFTIQDKTIEHLITPNDPLSIDQSTNFNFAQDKDGNTHYTEGFTGAKSYTVTADVPNIEAFGSTQGLTANKLRAAGTDYPPGLVDMYVKQGTQDIGERGKALLQTILDSPYNGNHALDNPYDIAKAMENYLASPDNFTYSQDITDAMNRECNGLSTVDCFAKIRTGFCQQYATTMVMLLRLEGIPARFVEGYLPGAMDEHMLVRRITRAAAHAWVEAYFPGYGWIEFDPTGGGHGAATVLPVGSKVTPNPSSSASPSFGARKSPIRRIQTDTPDRPGAGGTSGGNWPVWPPIAFGGVAGLALLGVLWYRRPPKAQSPEAVYEGVVRWASLLGYKPQPTQTVFEYVGSLQRAVPTASPELQMVAAAKVEVTYGRRQLGLDRLRALSQAGRRLRLALMRLALRVPRRRRRTRR